MNLSMASKFLFTLIFLVFAGLLKCSSVTIDNGGYQQLVVAVSPRIGKNELENVIAKLEDLFSKSSEALHISTREMFYFKEVLFLLPVRPNKSGLVIEKRMFTKADIHITEDGTSPYTVQHAGCGERALRINFPVAYLAKSFAHKAFVQQWAHYRYGVFDEHGYPDDPLYPLLYRIPGSDLSSAPYVTGCSFEKAVYTFQNASGHECDPSDLMPKSGCLPELDAFRNEHLMSSLMDKFTLTKASQFCDDGTNLHDTSSPSMQNVLCREQSVWTVISQNADFKNRTGTVLLTRPTFRYFVEPTPRFVFVIEATEKLAQNKRIDLLRNAFTYFVLYDAPRQSKISIVNLRKVLERYSFNVAWSVDSILDTFPEAYGKADICLDCGVNAAVQALQDDDSDSDGFIIMVVSTDISEDKLEKLTKRLIESRAVLFVLFFGPRSTTRLLFEDLTAATGGRLFYVIDDMALPKKDISTLTTLYEFFRMIYEYISWQNRNKALVAQQVFQHDQEHGSLAFAIEKNIETLHVIFTGPDFVIGPPVIKEKLILKLNGMEYRGERTTFAYRISIPAYMFSIQHPQPGLWEASFQRKPDYSKPVAVLIRAENSDFQQIISTKCWMESAKVEKRSVKMPPAIYAEIRKGNQPVTNSLVVATLHHYDSGKEFEYHLLDFGEGNPDIRREDGLYTRCLTNVTMKGYYLLTVSVKSIVEDEDVEPSRIATCGTYHLDGQFLVTNFPPRRITDLRITRVRRREYGITYFIVEWTAPGDEYDYGKANEYEMKLFRNRQDAANNFASSHVVKITEWETHGPWLEPGMAGQLQQVIIELHNLTSGHYYLAMRTKDNDGNYGDVSNIVELYHKAPTIPTTSGSTSTGTSSLKTSIGITTAATGKMVDNSNTLEIAVGVTCGLLFLMAIIAVFLIVYFSKRRKNRKAKKNKISPPYFPRQRPEISESIYKPPQVTTASSDNPGFSDSAWIKSTDDGGSFNYYSLPTVSKRVHDNISLAPSTSTFRNEAPPFHSVQNPSYSGHSPFSETSVQNGTNPPFNPMYTSSLRKMHEPNIHSYRLGTDV